MLHRKEPGETAPIHLTITGIVIVVVIIALLLIIAAFVRQKNASRKAALTTKQLVYSAVAIALAVVCSMIKLFEMPMGGSVTLLSMLFIVLIAYWYGPYVGIMTAVAYGLVQFVTEPIFYTIPQMLLDYPLAFGALGLAGFFNKKKWGLQIGYVVGVFGRFIFSTISGIVFFASYAPEGMNPILYSLGYQASYLVPEAVITLIIISIPPVAKALAHVKQNAVESIKSKNSHTVFISKRYDCFLVLLCINLTASARIHTFLHHFQVLQAQTLCCGRHGRMSPQNASGCSRSGYFLLWKHHHR